MSTTSNIVTRPPNTLKWISTVTAALVGLLALGSLALSYEALRALATANGLSGWQAYIWPLLIDASLVVFSLSVVRNSLRGERTRWPWLLVGIYTAGTVAFNLIHSPGHPTGWAVAIVAPLSLFLSFETLMGHLRSDVLRSTAINSLTELQAQQEQLLNNVGKLAQQEERLQASLRDLRKEKRSVATVSDKTKAQAAQILVTEPDISGGELARRLGKAASTGRRLKRQLAPQLNGSGA